MTQLRSKVNPNDPEFLARYADMNALVAELESKLAQCHTPGPEKYVQRHREKGKMLAHERVQMLLDPGTEFLELLPLAGVDNPDMTPGGSIIGGIGTVCGVCCLINANVPTLKGGALNLAGVLKSQRLDTIARENRLPTIYLTESAGADLPQQSQVYNIGGASFREISRRSKLGIPSITVVFGNSTAGGAYIPGMSDYVVMIRNQSKVFLAGPPLVKMATNEITDDETLGGADMHARISGLADFLVDNEEEALNKVREIVASFPAQPSAPQITASAPVYGTDELLGVVSIDTRKPTDPREVIARIVDGSDLLEFKPYYGPTLVTGFAKIQGFNVGIIANNGVLLSESANKGAHFIQLCEQQNIPLLFLQNITGFMVGKKVEQEGIIKHGAKLINAVSNMEVPAITILMGASYGAGNYAMCGRSFEPRFLFAWPNSKLAVMGSRQLAGVMETIKKDAAAKYGEAVDEGQMQQIRAETMEQIERESSAYYASSRVWDDGVIDPRQTRKIVGQCLQIIYRFPIATQRRFGIFRM